jgi:flagellin
LLASGDAATNSIAKLSSGTRVNSAKDDAASLAIGSRLRAEVAALKTASVNASQAGSLLQIADGALATVADILIRMKELAVQASSGQFSSIERGVLDSEFQALSEEITRISNDTEFNGTKLIAGGASTATTTLATTNFAASGNGYSISIDPTKVADNSAFKLNFDNVTAVAQISTVTFATNPVIGENFTVNVTDNAAGKTYTATYTAAVATVADVTAGITAALNNVVGITVTAVDTGGGVVTLTAKTAGNAFSTTASTNSATTTEAIATTTANVVGGEFLSVHNLTDGTKQTIDIAPILDGVASAGAGLNLIQTETAKVSFASLGVDVTLDANFDRTTDNSTAGTIVEAGGNFAGETVTIDTDGGVTNAALKALLALDSTVYDAATGNLTLTVTDGGATTLVGATGIRIGVNGGAFGAVSADSADLVSAALNQTIEVAVDVDGQAIQIAQITHDAVTSTASGTLIINVGKLSFGADVVAGSSTQSFSFKVGSGAETYDSLSFSVSAASANSLGVLGTSQGGSIGITTAALADAASAAVSDAINTLNQTRSDIGAAQNRLTFAASNLASAIENAEAARSGLLDLDVAAEITTFTSKQILVQTGVSTLAQANQLPQNLLRLFQ